MNQGPLSVHESDRAVVLRFKVHRIIDGTALDAWSQSPAVAPSGGRHVLLDFSNVQFISSAALNRLIVLEKALRESGQRLVLFGLQRPVHTIMSITRMDQVFTIVADESSAWAALDERRSSNGDGPPDMAAPSGEAET